MTTLTYPPSHALILRAIPRYRRILALRAAGVPGVDIARLLGISRQRVDQLVRQAEQAKAQGYF